MTTRSPDALPAADRIVAVAQMVVPALKTGERITRRKMNAAVGDICSSMPPTRSI